MSNVFIAGAALTHFGKHLDKSVRDLSEQAVSACLADAGLEPELVDAIYFANSLGGLLTGQESIRGQVALRHTGLMGKPIINVENACASSSTAFYLARLSILAGECDVALVVGAEKMYHPDKNAPIEALKTCADNDERAALVKRIGGRDESSLFMDLYSHLTREYMDKRGIDSQLLAEVVVKNRYAGSLNPIAQFRKETTVEEVLNSRLISEPLTLPMCSSIGDGAGAVLLCSERFLRQRQLTGTRVAACALVSGEGDKPDFTPAATMAARRAFDHAGITPDQISLVELHDAGAPAELWLVEQIGLAENGVELFRSGDTRLNGRMPINPSGGLVSRGHPIGATGVAQLTELHNQLRGRCGERQVANAGPYALAENGGGWLGDDAAATVVTILARD